MVKTIISTTIFWLIVTAAIAQVDPNADSEMEQWIRYDYPAHNNTFSLPADVVFTYNNENGFDGTSPHLNIRVGYLFNLVLNDTDKEYAIREWMTMWELKDAELQQSIGLANNGYKMVSGGGIYKGLDTVFFLYTDPKYTGMNFLVTISYNAQEEYSIGYYQAIKIIELFKPIVK